MSTDWKLECAADIILLSMIKCICIVQQYLFSTPCIFNGKVLKPYREFKLRLDFPSVATCFFHYALEVFFKPGEHIGHISRNFSLRYREVHVIKKQFLVKEGN